MIEKMMKTLEAIIALSNEAKSEKQEEAIMETGNLLIQIFLKEATKAENEALGRELAKKALETLG